MSKSSLLSVALFLSVSITASASLRCGGDGPRPLADITPDVPVVAKELHPRGDIQQALFLDTRNIALYRNRQGELRALGLTSAKDYLLGALSAPLSKLLDPNQEHVLVENLGSLWRYPVSTQWEDFSAKTLVHGFWKDGALYSVEPTPPTGNPASFRVMKYTTSTRKFTEQCRFDVSTTPDIKLAEGHSYPYFFFHASNTWRGGSVSRLVVWKYDIEKCQAQPIVFPDQMKGSAQKVARFENLRSTLVRTNEVGSSVLWRTSATCDYVDTEEDAVFPVRYDLPIVFTWSEAHGLHIVNLDRREKVKLLSDVNITALGTADLNLDATGGRVLITPSVGPKRGKQFFDIKVDWPEVR